VAPAKSDDDHEPEDRLGVEVDFHSAPERPLRDPVIRTVLNEALNRCCEVDRGIDRFKGRGRSCPT